jgi:YVTN family beta-propeller protein
LQRLAIAVLAGILFPGIRAWAVGHDLFVSLRDRDHVSVIDLDRKPVVETVNVGLAPQFIGVSSAPNQLVVGDQNRVRVFRLGH